MPLRLVVVPDRAVFRWTKHSLSQIPALRIVGVVWSERLGGGGPTAHSDRVSRLRCSFGCAVVEWVAGWWLTLGREVMSVPGGRMTRTPATPRTVTSRVLAILGAFASERRELGLVEISRRTGLAVSTTHRLVGELLEGGALERSADRRYRIGPTVRDLVVSPTARAQDYGRPRRPE